MTRHRLLGAVGLAALFAQSWPREAAAYCRTRACESTGTCAPDDEGCASTGPAVYWSSACVSFSVESRGCPSQGIDAEELQAAVAAAFDIWTSTDCGGASPSLRGVATEPIECGRHEFNAAGPNANVFTCRDDGWLHPGTDDVLALTTLTFAVDTGEIYDADTELNTTEASFYLGEAQTGAFDLAGVLAHEVGHFLGFAHVHPPESAMFPGFEPEVASHRGLTADDATGLCRTYPPSREPASEDCEPRHGLSVYCSLEGPELTPESKPAPLARDGAAAAEGCQLGRGARSRAPHGPEACLAMVMLGALSRRRSGGQLSLRRTRRSLAGG